MRLTSYRNLTALVTCHTLYVVFIDLAECCVFGKQSVDPFHCDPLHFGDSFFLLYSERLPVWGSLFASGELTILAESPKCSGHPFFRSYGARLPSSLTRFHSRALAQLCPPTCVGFRYGQPWEHAEVFLGSCFNGSALAEASTSLPSYFERCHSSRELESIVCSRNSVETIQHLK